MAEEEKKTSPEYQAMVAEWRASPLFQRELERGRTGGPVKQRRPLDVVAVARRAIERATGDGKLDSGARDVWVQKATGDPWGVMRDLGPGAEKTVAIRPGYKRTTTTLRLPGYIQLPRPLQVERRTEGKSRFVFRPLDVLKAQLSAVLPPGTLGEHSGKVRRAAVEVLILFWNEAVWKALREDDVRHLKRGSLPRTPWKAILTRAKKLLAPEAAQCSTAAQRSTDPSNYPSLRTMSSHLHESDFRARR